LRERVFEFLAGLMTVLRLSPIMVIILGGLFLLDFASALFATVSIFGPIAPEPDVKTGWRPPALAASDPNQGVSVNGADADALMRPIFRKSRRPEMVENNASTKLERVEPPPSVAGFVLSAIVKVGKTARAFVVSSSQPEGKWLLVGEEIEGWKISEVRDSEVVLSNGDRYARLGLYPDDASRQEGTRKLLQQ
jgi:hypothetical protein